MSYLSLRKNSFTEGDDDDDVGGDDGDDYDEDCWDNYDDAYFEKVIMDDDVHYTNL